MKQIALHLDEEELSLLSSCKQALFTKNTSYAVRFLIHNWEKILPLNTSFDDTCNSKNDDFITSFHQSEATHE